MRPNETEMISVIMPVYNAEKTVERTIGSVLSQTRQNFELIIVDDGSTDGTAEICKKTGPDKIVYFHQENAGPAAARNLGLSKARGSLICFVDADDTVQEDYLQVLADTIRGADMAVCGFRVLNEIDFEEVPAEELIPAEKTEKIDPFTEVLARESDFAEETLKIDSFEEVPAEELIPAEQTGKIDPFTEVPAQESDFAGETMKTDSFEEVPAEELIPAEQTVKIDPFTEVPAEDAASGENISGQEDPSEPFMRETAASAMKLALKDDLVGGFLWNKIFRRNLLEENGIRFNKKLFVGEDLFFVEQYLACCKNVHITKKELYNYYSFGDSISHVVSRKNVTLLRSLEEIHGLSDDPGFREMVTIRYTRQFLAFYPYFPKDKRLMGRFERFLKKSGYPVRRIFDGLTRDYKIRFALYRTSPKLYALCMAVRRRLDR